MTNMKAAERAAELANAVPGSWGKWTVEHFLHPDVPDENKVLVQFIADADAAARKARDLLEENTKYIPAFLSPFILPDDVDPLVEAIKDCKLATLDCIEVDVAARLRAALASRGLEIVEQGR